MNTQTIVAGWNATVHLPADYATSNKQYPVIYFFPGLGEIGTNPSLAAKYGPNAYIAQGWDGKINGRDYIVASLQCPAGYSRPWQVKTVVDAFESKYRVDKPKVAMTGLSNGGWVSNQFATYKDNATDLSYIKRVMAVVNVQGVKPDDQYGATPPYPKKFIEYAANGGKMLGFEQKLDGRDIPTITSVMNTAVPDSSVCYVTEFGNGGHNYWWLFYGGNGSSPTSFPGIGNMYQWIDAQLFALPQNQLPLASAGADTEYVLGADILLVGNATDPDGTIVSALWEQIAGPAAEILSPNGYTTQIRPPSSGVYTFRMTVTDNAGGKNADEVTINVKASPATLVNTIKLFSDGTYALS